MIRALPGVALNRFQKKQKIKKNTDFSKFSWAALHQANGLDTLETIPESLRPKRNHCLLTRRRPSKTTSPGTVDTERAEPNKRTANRYFETLEQRHTCNKLANCNVRVCATGAAAACADERRRRALRRLRSAPAAPAAGEATHQSVHAHHKTQTTILDPY